MSADFQDSLRTERHEAQRAADQDALYARIEAEQDAELDDLAEQFWARDEGWDYPQTITRPKGAAA